MSPAMTMTHKINTTPNFEMPEMERQYQKGVKLMSDNGIEHVPKKYILPVDERPNAIVREKSSGPEVNLSLPVIDLAQLQGPNRRQALQSLAYACETYGFFQLVNHGLPDEITSNMVNVGKNFFKMPFGEREKYMTSDMRTPCRYGTSFNQTKDGVFCWRDFLKLVCHPLPEVLPYWPSSPVAFRKWTAKYSQETKKLFLMLVEAILESLGIEDTKKKTQLGANEKDEDNSSCGDDLIKELLEDGSQIIVVNCYPPCPEPDLTLGMPPHSDYGFLTLVLQDEVQGLQIQHQDRWFNIQPMPGSFVVNVGDHLEIFSNGRYKSVLHRVLVNSLRNRISVASLHSFPFKTIVRPSPKLIDETNPRRYMDTDFATFLQYVASCDSKKKNFLESRKLK